MPRFSGSDKIVIGDIEPFPQTLEPFNNPVGKNDWSFFCCRCSFFHLLSVLICSCCKYNITPLKPFCPCNHIACDRCICMSYMRNIIYIVYWCCYIKRFIHLPFFLFCFSETLSDRTFYYFLLPLQFPESHRCLCLRLQGLSRF